MKLHSLLSRLLVVISIISIMSCDGNSQNDNALNNLDANEKLITPTNQTFILSDAELSEQKSKATSGDKDAAFKVYQHYEFGTLEIGEGMYWLKLSAEHGHIIGQYNWGHVNLYEYRYEEEALYWFKKAADQGHKDARTYVNLILLPEDLYTLSALAENGDVEAAKLLYNYYRYIKQDLKQAEYWRHISEPVK